MTDEILLWVLPVCFALISFECLVLAVLLFLEFRK